MRQIIFLIIFFIAGQSFAAQYMTEAEKRKARVETLSKLTDKDMIIYKPQSTKATVTIFTDLDCGYCQKLHHQIPELLKSGIEIRLVTFPRQGAGSSAYNRMVSVVCSSNPKEALEKAIDGENIPPKTCKHSLDSYRVIARQLGVPGTPSIIYADGTLQGGYLPPDRLVRAAIKHTPALEENAKETAKETTKETAKEKENTNTKEKTKENKENIKKNENSKESTKETKGKETDEQKSEGKSKEKTSKKSKEKSST